LNAIIGFASGIGVSIIAAVISYLFQRRGDRRRHRESAAFQAYMLLLDLHGHYFWIASNEIRGEPPPAEMASKVCRLAMQIADKLREADDIPHLRDILTVLMSEDAYKTANDRATALNAVIDKLGETVNPRYVKIVQKISDDNVRGFVDRPSGHRNNAPALMHH
jgi:uncharacterized membrane protein YccC